MGEATAAITNIRISILTQHAAPEAYIH